MDTVLFKRITATFTGPRRKSLFPKAARPAAPCATYCYHAFPRRSVSSQIPSLPNGLRQEYRRFLSSILARNQKRQILRQKDFGNGMHTQNHLRRIPDHGFEQRCFVSRLGSAVVIDMRPRTSAPSITQHRVSRQLRISFATQHTLLACGAGGQ